jgi:replicative DNA helicase
VAIYRGSVYGDPVKGVDWHPDWEGHAYEPSRDEFEATAQLIVMKNSNGRTGNIFASWRGETTNIS